MAASSGTEPDSQPAATVPESIKVALQVIAWCVIGVVIMAFAVWVTDVQRGQILLSLGMLVGYTGIVVTLWLAYLRAEERGDL